MLEYIADTWERRSNSDRRQAARSAEAEQDRRQDRPGRRHVDLDRVIDQAERRLADANYRLQVLRDYHAYLGEQIAGGSEGCDNTFRHTEYFFSNRTGAVDLRQAITLLILLQASCDCEAYATLHEVLT